MPQAAAVATIASNDRYPLGDFLSDIAGIAASTEFVDRKRRSRDYSWYSPILQEKLKDNLADIVVTPRDEVEVVRVAAACAKHRIPLTVRGGATGNYGQCVPLEGGVVLDMALLNRIEWQKPGLVRVQAGAVAHASFDQAFGGHRRVRGGRQRRGRQRHLWRHARAGEHRRGADRDARA